MTTCWMALDDTAADTGTIYYVRGSHQWPHARLGGTFHAPDDWLGHVREAMPAGAELELVPIEVPGRWSRHSRRLDLPRQSAQRALRRPAPLDRQPHDLDRHALEPGSQRTRSIRATAAPARLELDEAFFPILWRDGYRTPWLDDARVEVGAAT